MFSGIIEATVEVIKAEHKNGSLLLTIQKPSQWKIKPGQSIATNGTCLTVASVQETTYTTELMPETLSKTTFAKKLPNYINLERSLKVEDRLDGHFVTGHIDTVGTISSITRVHNSHEFTFTFDQEFAPLTAKKGSICIDGISLTIANSTKKSVTVHIVEYTHQHTSLSHQDVGDQVNIEFDILAKYINKSLEMYAIK